MCSKRNRRLRLRLLEPFFAESKSRWVLADEVFVTLDIQGPTPIHGTNGMFTYIHGNPKPSFLGFIKL